MEKYQTRYVLSVLAADMVGILSRITSAITDMGANIEGISQTVVQGYFTVILIAAFKGKRTEEQVSKTVLSRFPNGRASIIVKPFDAKAPDKSSGEKYVLTMYGKDRPGILKKVTTFMAQKNVNFEDLFFRIEGNKVTHIGEVTVPRSLDIKHLQNEFCELMKPLEMTVKLQHENLFRVTNEIGAIRQILKDTTDASNR